MDLPPRSKEGLNLLRLPKACLAWRTKGESDSSCELIWRPKTVRAITSIAKAPMNLDGTEKHGK